MKKAQNVNVTPDDDGMRIDRWFKNHFPEISFGYLQKLLRSGQIRLNGKRVKAKHHISDGQLIRIPPLSNLQNANSQKLYHQKHNDGLSLLTKSDRDYLEAMIIHEDDNIIALNKNEHIASQGGSGQKTSIDELIKRYYLKSNITPKLVHRLDISTSGILIIAKSRNIASIISKKLQQREVEKVYLAIVKGNLQKKKGEVSSYIAPLDNKGSDDNKKSKRSQKLSISQYVKLSDLSDDLHLVALKPLTGRKHQLRIHMAQNQTPILGDYKYGDDFKLMKQFKNKVFLHARYISFFLNENDSIKLWANLPEYFSEYLKEHHYNSNNIPKEIDLLFENFKDK